MTNFGLFPAALALLLAAAPALAQQPDYLTSEEVEKVRETQEPNQRVKLFLELAKGRLLTFNSALLVAPGREPAHRDDLRDMLNDFIRAVDDTAGTLETALDRGGVELRKTREPVAVHGKLFLTVLQEAQQTDQGVSEDLRYDLEDAVEAAQDLMALGKEIPDGFIPPKRPTAAGTKAGKEPARPPGRPTLKRRDDDKSE